ncbi:MAG: hypothetical protein K1W41_01920 [Lachnospiraceae bacterium]
MMTVFTIISAITFCHYSGIILGEVIAFFAITNGKAPSLFNIMAAIFTVCEKPQQLVRLIEVGE